VEEVEKVEEEVVEFFFFSPLLRCQTLFKKKEKTSSLSLSFGFTLPLSDRKPPRLPRLACRLIIG